jgi:NAD(P)-dependent dehydrogenase (short-subunit alcohol dehydrogenase family)
VQSVLITGATGGLGRECAREIARSSDGWHVIVSGRDATRAAELAADIAASGRNGGAQPLQLDLASLDSVRDAASELTTSERHPLRAIVCNGALQVVGDVTFTGDGFETTFAVNHLAHFLLVNLLLERLEPPARIVFVASGVHDPARSTGMPAPRLTGARAAAAGETDDESAGTAGRRRYATSKLANVMCAYELHRRLRAAGRDRIDVNAFDPGLMPGTGLARDYGGLQRLAWRFVLPALRPLPGVSSPRAAARALARLAVAPELAGISGSYFRGERESRSSNESYDEARAARLWVESAELVGVPSHL